MGCPAFAPLFSLVPLHSFQVYEKQFSILTVFGYFPQIPVLPSLQPTINTLLPKDNLKGKRIAGSLALLHALPHHGGAPLGQDANTPLPAAESLRGFCGRQTHPDQKQRATCSHMVLEGFGKVVWEQLAPRQDSTERLSLLLNPHLSLGVRSSQAWDCLIWRSLTQ